MSVDAIAVLGGVLEECMEVDQSPSGQSLASLEQSRQRVGEALARFGFSSIVDGIGAF